MDTPICDVRRGSSSKMTFKSDTPPFTLNGSPNHVRRVLQPKRGNTQTQTHAHTCGNCSVSCQTHSRNCVKTGDTSLGSPSNWSHLATGREQVSCRPREKQVIRQKKHLYLTCYTANDKSVIHKNSHASNVGFYSVKS